VCTQVHIVLRDSSLPLVSQAALRGTQMGEGYGFSVLGANLRGTDGYICVCTCIYW